MKKLKDTRPISPFLTLYFTQENSLQSVNHRVTGLVLSSIIVLSILLKIYTEYFILYNEISLTLIWYFRILLYKNYLLSSCLIFVVLASFLYHLTHGIKHIIWDLKKGLERNEYKKNNTINYIILMLSMLYYSILFL
uniref:Succinate dehydrogenase subunit 3 n=1 Tax=Cyanoptyche gloeocystis TaxID=77922 RepID=A0A096Y6V6_9EUKA|nr:succinate dehydrogenase subunit 3 [Cyanoptyche gloeocystis]AIM52070.1 succinate dehydrogenase subunit 3 [Cyanoptyche gloeocystis]